MVGCHQAYGNGTGFLLRDKEDGSATQAYSVDRDIWVDDAELGTSARDYRQGHFYEVDSESEVREITDRMKHPTLGEGTKRIIALARERARRRSGSAA